MKRKLLLILVFVVGCSSPKEIFEAGSMKKDLVSDLLVLSGHSVVRDHQTKLHLIDSANAVYTVKEAVTIYDKEEKDKVRLVLGYDQFRSIDYINANILDANGEIVRSYTAEDADDYSAYSGYTFFSDNRVKVLELNYNSFPYTTEVEYQMSYNGILNLPSWYPKMLGQSLQQASLTVIDGTKGGLRYTANMVEEPVVEDSVLGDVYSWKLGMMSAKKREVLGPPARDILPSVTLAPTNFSIENTTGIASDWQSFGKWYYKLGEDSRNLSDAAKQEVDLVLSGISDEKEKVLALYKYLQNKTRYVSIQLGIGGWKPFPADYVFKNEYGDCKALTNYMHAILDYAGIKVKPALIRNGLSESKVLVDFPGNQFNHVIIQVTLSNGEVIWLECTSKYIPAGQIGRGNEGKYALLISPEGGEIILTPESNASENLQVTYSEIDVNEDGSALLSSTVRRKGIPQSNLLHELLPVSERQKVEWLQDKLSMSAYKIKSTDFTKVNADLDGTAYNYELELDSYASTSSSRLFIPLNVINKWKLNLPEEESRSQGVWLSYNFSELDSSVFKLPEGYKIESLPSDLSIDKDFGKYEAKYTVTEFGEVLYKRELILNEKKLKADQYEDFRDFFNQVTLSDSKNFVIVKDI